MAENFNDNNNIPYDESSYEGQIVRTSTNYYQEAKYAKRDRMLLNKRNFDTYHLKQDFSHKKTGQSKEFLPKQQLAVEQISGFIQQSLVDIGDWAKVEAEDGIENPKILPEEMTLLTMRQLEKAKFYGKVTDMIKLGLLGGLIIVKVHGKYTNKPRFYPQTVSDGGKLSRKLFVDRSKKVWELQVDLIRHEDYYPDPTGRGLYEGQDIEMDFSDVLALSKGPNAIFEPSVVEMVKSDFADYEQVAKKSREQNQNFTQTSFRKRVLITEFWGTLIDSSSGEVIKENCVWRIANRRYLISPPKDNPFWHQKSPFVVSPLVTTPTAVWHRALMDGPTNLNIAENELFNLIVDGGMAATHGIKQIRTDWLEDESQVADGVPPGTTLSVSSQCPPGQKVLERVDTGSITPESINVYQLINSEFQQSALTNDLRLGVLPSRQVKATEVVEMNNTITSVFSGLAKVVEQEFLRPVLDLSWQTIAQHQNDLDQNEVKNLLTKDRASAISALSPEEVFASTVEGHHFKVYGISLTLSKMKDFKKLTALLQTISSAEPLIEAFIQRFSFEKLMDKIMKSLDIDTRDLEISDEEKALNAMAQGQGGMGLGSTPNQQSNIPQAGTGPSGNSIQANSPQPAGMQKIPASPVSSIANSNG